MIKPTKYPMNPDDMADLFDQAVNQGKNGKQDTLVSGTNIKTINGASVLGSGDLTISSTPSWGSITGTLSSQTDLNTALSGKESSITAGTTAQYYRGDKTFQTLDKSAVGLGNVDNTSDANKPISTATQTALNAKASTGAVTGTGITMSTARILGRSTTGTGAIEEITIGSGMTLSAGTLTASGGSSGLTVGTTAITSGTVGRVLFEGTGNVLQESANLFWDNTNGRLGIAQSIPTARIHIQGSSALSANSSLVVFNSTPTEIFRIRDNGNVQIGALTDAGFKLDVNGTARVQSGLTISGQTANNYLTIGTGTGNAFFVWSAYFLGVNGVKFRSEYLIGDPSGAATTVRASAAIDSRGYLVTDSIGIGTTTNTINASAIAQINSTTKGFLPPRMTTTQKNAIATPAAGLVVYDTTLNKLCVYTTAWETITSL